MLPVIRFFAVLRLLV